MSHIRPSARATPEPGGRQARQLCTAVVRSRYVLDSGAPQLCTTTAQLPGWRGVLVPRGSRNFEMHQWVVQAVAEVQVAGVDGSVDANWEKSRPALTSIPTPHTWPALFHPPSRSCPRPSAPPGI